MEEYTNNNNQFPSKLIQPNETIFPSSKMYGTNQFGQLCYVTTSQNPPQAGPPTSTMTTAVSHTDSQLHVSDNVTSVCSSSPITSHNTAELYANHIFTPTGHDNISNPKHNTTHINTNTPMAEIHPKSFQGCTNDNETGYQREHPQSQMLDQITTVVTKNNHAADHRQNSHPSNSTTTTTATTSISSAMGTGSKSKAPMISHQFGKVYYHCDICLRPFAQRHYLAIHKRSHTGDKPFQCDFCIQKFARRDTLQIHRRIHTGEKPFHCDVCSKQFAQRDKLQIHRRTHSRKKQFSCDVCLKQFAQRDYVEIHKRSHTGEKPFECDFCAQKFVRKNTLDVHRRMHTNERPYHCEFCGEMFAQTNKLKRHKKSAHGVIGGDVTSGTGVKNEGETMMMSRSPESDPTSTSSPCPSPGTVPISNMVALAATSSKITEDYPTISNQQLWLL